MQPTTLTRDIDGAKREFRMLTRADYATLAERLHYWNKQDAADNLRALQAVGIKQDQLPMIVAQLTKRPSYPQVCSWIGTPQGGDEAVALAAGISADEVRQWQDHIAVQEIALEVSGLHTTKEGAGEVPKSQTPSTTSATG